MACLMMRIEDVDRGILFAKAHTERVIPYVMIDIDSPTVLEDIKKFNSMGFKGLGELFAKNEWNYYDRKYDTIWHLRSDTRRVGKECVSKSTHRWGHDH